MFNFSPSCVVLNAPEGTIGVLGDRPYGLLHALSNIGLWYEQSGCEELAVKLAGEIVDRETFWDSRLKS